MSRVTLQPTGRGGTGAACLEVTSTLLLVADSRGGLHLYSCALHAGQLAPPALLSSAPPAHGKSHEPACMEFLPHSTLARGPAVLLVDCQGRVLLHRLHEKVGLLAIFGTGKFVCASAQPPGQRCARWNMCTDIGACCAACAS